MDYNENQNFESNENEFDKSKYFSTLLGGTVFKRFDYYGEFAHRINAGDAFLGFSNDDSYGAYFNLSYSTAGFGVSFELKDYQNFLRSWIKPTRL